METIKLNGTQAYMVRDLVFKEEELVTELMEVEGWDFDSDPDSFYREQALRCTSGWGAGSCGKDVDLWINGYETVEEFLSTVIDNIDDVEHKIMDLA